MLKTVEEIREMERTWLGSEDDDVVAGNDAIQDIFRTLIGITEHLNGKSTHDRLNEILVVESSRVSSTCQQIIREIEKIKEHMPPVDGNRKVQIDTLRWWDRVGKYAYTIDSAIAHLENGGSLETK